MEQSKTLETWRLLWRQFIHMQDTSPLFYMACQYALLPLPLCNKRQEEGERRGKNFLLCSLDLSFLCWLLSLASFLSSNIGGCGDIGQYRVSSCLKYLLFSKPMLCENFKSKYWKRRLKLKNLILLQYIEPAIIEQGERGRIISSRLDNSQRSKCDDASLV